MKLKLPTLNNGIIKTNIKRFWWISALMGVYLFLVFPYRVINDSFYRNSNPFDYLIESCSLVYGLLLPIVVGCFSLSYLHKVNSTSAYHALPVTRESLLLSSLVSGIVIIAIPMVINAILLFMLMPTSSDITYTVYDVLKICRNYFIYSILQFQICLLVGMFTGNIFAQGVFAVILNLLPMAFYMFSNIIINMFLYGYPGESGEFNSFLEKTPIVSMFDISKMNITLFLVYLFSFIVIFLLTLFFYKKRPLEAAGDVITFKFFKPIFKYGATTFVTIFGYIAVIGEEKEIGGIFIALIFAVIGYAAAEMLLTKSFRFWKGYKGFLIYIVVFTLSVSAIAFDIFGYGTYIPENDKIQTAYICFDTNSYTDFEIICGLDKNERRFPVRGVAFKSPENIEKVTKLHSQILESSPSDYNQRFISLGYVLKNGETVFRYYECSSEATSAVTEILNSDEYIQGNYPFLSTPIDNVSYAEAICYYPENDYLISEKEALISLIDCLKYDLTHRSNYPYLQSEGYIELRLWSEKDTVRIELYPDMKKTKVFLNSQTPRK